MLSAVLLIYAVNALCGEPYGAFFSGADLVNFLVAVYNERK